MCDAARGGPYYRAAKEGTGDVYKEDRSSPWKVVFTNLGSLSLLLYYTLYSWLSVYTLWFNKTSRFEHSLLLITCASIPTCGIPLVHKTNPARILLRP